MVLAVIYIAGTANFYNFMDGINGIAGITGIVGFGLLGFYLDITDVHSSLKILVGGVHLTQVPPFGNLGIGATVEWFRKAGIPPQCDPSLA